MTYPFGQDLTLYFQPLDNDAPATIPTALQTQTPAIYVYDALPSRSAAAAGTGAIQTITSWTWDSAKNAWSYTVDGVDDPDPTGSTRIRTYYIAHNFILSASEQIQTAIRSFDLERVQGSIDPLVVTISDLQGAYPPIIGPVCTESQAFQYIDHATTIIKAKLKAGGYRWAQIHEPKELKLAVVYKAITAAMLVQIQAGNDKFAAKYKEFKDELTVLLDGLSFGYDADGDGTEDGKETAKKAYWNFIR